MKAYVILNPVAGQDDPATLKELFDRFESEGRWTYDLYETTGKEDMGQIIKEALKGDYDMVVACGGDGTISEVANGLANQTTPLGIIPGGTGNAFAAGLGLPEKPEAALDLLAGEHRIITSDALQVEDRFFVLNCSLGVTSSSIQATSRQKKDRLGGLAYILTGLKKLLGLEPIDVTFIVDGQRHRFKAAEVICFNSDVTGVLKKSLGLGVRLNDGILDLYAFRSRTALDFLRIAINVLRGQSKEDPHIRYWTVRQSVRIDTEPAIPFQADGDLQGKTPFTIKVAKDALKIVAPLD